MTTDIGAEEREIRDTVERWFEAETRKDVEATMGFMAEDVVLQAPNMAQIDGRKAATDFFRTFFDVLVSVDGSAAKVEVSEAGDFAYGLGPNRTVIAGPDGSMEERGKWLIVWKKVDGEWKAVAASSTSDGPGGT